MAIKKKNSRLKQDEWLERSLAQLVQNKGKFNIDELVKKLGVTKGSFYWHFKNRDDFIHKLLDYWESSSTQRVFDEMEKYSDVDAEKRLLVAMRLLRDKAVCQHDLAMRNMAALNKQAAAKVLKVDKMRLNFVNNLFRDIGFRGKDLEVRVHVFAVFHSLREGFLGKKLTDSEAELKAMHAFFIKK
jgi:AcrR family transcriptional regulator